MIDRNLTRSWTTWFVCGGVLALSLWLGMGANELVREGRISLTSCALLPLIALAAAAMLLFALRDLRSALTWLVIAAGTLDMPIGTGTQSTINLAMILAALFTIVWVARMLLEPDAVHLARTRANRALLSFLVALGLSWLIGFLVLDPRIPIPANALVVQGGQVAIFVFSGTAFLLGASIPLGQRTLKTWVLATTCVAVLGWISESGLVPAVPFVSIVQPPLALGFVLLLSQLILNHNLSTPLRLLGWGIMCGWAVTTYSSRLTFLGAWTPIAFGTAVILWVRSRRLFFAAIAAGLLLLLLDPEPVIRIYTSKAESGSFLRQDIWWDVVRMTFQSPVSVLFGLGPVNYKWNWFNPSFVSISQPLTGTMYIAANDASVYYAPPSHNMFVDIYAQTGLFGFLLFLWLLYEIIKIGWGLAARAEPGFMRAYVVGVLAGFVGLVVVSGTAADWLVPFVYNIGLSGFRSSIYVWLMAGSLMRLCAQYRAAHVSEGMD